MKEYRVVYTHPKYGVQHMNVLSLHGAQSDVDSLNKRAGSDARIEVRETELVVVKDWEEV